MNALPHPPTVTDGLFTHPSDTPKFPIEDFNPLEELEDDAEPDDTPYNSWERSPDGWPGNNGLLTL